MSNYYVKTIERAAAPRSKRLRETGGYHSGGTSFPGGGYLPLTGGTITGDLRVRGNFIVGDVVVAMDANGRLHISKGVVSDGDLAAFGAEESEGGGSCGLDIARLWEELKAEDASNVIDVSHIPGSVVLQDELTEILDDYPLTTEVNTALAGKADKDWVEEELAKYLLLTGGKISGDLEVTGTLKIGDAVLSYADGRLHVSSTVTSDGDFVAYGDDEGGTAGGGLDVARLWEELGTDDSSKVIDVSHIPGSVVLQDELTEILDDYPLTTEVNTALAGKASLQHSHAITDITNLQAALSSKWVWNASQIAGVKVNNAVAADKLATARKINGTEFLGTQDITTAKWGMARSMRIGDYYGSNGAAVSIDGSGTSGYVLPLPQSIKVKTLDVDGVTLSVVDGRLHISATATSAGDFVAYGDETGSSGSGGLDISRLWDELRADDSSKVIDISHIPSIPTSKITGLDNALSGYVSSVTTSGAGNAVTGYAKSGNTLTLKKDLTFLTSVSLATISDLNSSWDALLKVAPTKYVTRWPTASEVGALTQATADGRYLRLSGGTMTGNLTLKSMSGTWLGGKTQAPIMTNGASSTSGNTYHPVIWGKTDAGDVWNLGHGASDQVGFFGFYSERTTNGTDWAHYIKVSDGTVHFNKTVYGTTFSGTLSGNATSATKLQASRTLWGRPFDGTGNVSGDMTGVGRIVASGPIRTHSINIECDNTGALGGYAAEINRTGFTNPLYLQHRGGNLYICANGGNVGIGTTSTAYKLDVAGTLRATGHITATSFTGTYLSDNSTNYWVGNAAHGAGSGKTGLLLYAYGSRNIYLYTNSTQRMVVNASGYVGINTTSPSYLLDVAGEIRATSGITIGSTDDYGWYISTGTRISAGIEVARGVSVGSLLVSSAWADYSKVPTNGIYSKGDIITGGRLFIPSSEGNDKYYIRIE